MNILEGSDSRTSTGFGGGRIVATSLFGGAILATVATASLAQTTYFPTAAALSIASASGYVVLGGNLAEGDGGGGTFMQGVTGCLQGDGGIVFPDSAGDCFYRTDPTYSVREWGALCDVVDVDAAGAASWTPDMASNTGTLTYPTTLVSTPLVVVSGGTPAPAPVFIAISQVGQPTLWPTRRARPFRRFRRHGFPRSVEYCRARTAAYKYSRRLEIIDDLPKTVTGELMRRKPRR